MNVSPSRNLYFTLDLLLSRGWNIDLISRFLQNPCEIISTNDSLSVSLYSFNRVCKIEMSYEFTGLLYHHKLYIDTTVEPLSRGQLKKLFCGSESKQEPPLFTSKVPNISNIEVRCSPTTDQLLDSYVKQLHINVKKVSLEKIKKRVLKQYNIIMDSKEQPRVSSVDEIPVPFSRLAVNMIRHEFTNYDEKTYALRSHDQTFYRAARNRVLDKIAEVYPEFKNACLSQKVR